MDKKFHEFTGNEYRTSITDAKVWLRAHVDDGAICPCCTQIAKVYKRSITSPMARILILIDRYFKAWSIKTQEEKNEMIRKYPTEILILENDHWLHVPSYLTRMIKDGSGISGADCGGDWAKLEYWGLLEKLIGTREDGSDRIGYWRITSLGRSFVASGARVPKHHRVYDGRNLDAAKPEETISIRDSIGNKFDYDKLMNGEQ